MRYGEARWSDNTVKSFGAVALPVELAGHGRDMGGARAQQGDALAGTWPARAPLLRRLAGTARLNHIVDWTGFFRDESGGYSYTQVSNFETEAWFESSAAEAGVLTTNYLTYDGAAVQPRCTISRSYVAVPSERLFVARYQLANTTAADITINVLDQLHPANQAVGAGRAVHAWYDAGRRALIADMTASGQLFVALGAFQDMDGYQAADDTQP